MILTIDYNPATKILSWTTDPTDDYFRATLEIGTLPETEEIYEGPEKNTFIDIDPYPSPLSVVVESREGTGWGEGKKKTLK